MKRNSNFECLRIFAMFVIMVSHGSLCSFSQSVLLGVNPYTKNLVFHNWNYFFDSLYLPLGQVGNHLFFIISGYFLGLGKISFKKVIKKIWKTLLPLWFYSLLFALLFIFLKKYFLFFSYLNFDPIIILHTFLPSLYGLGSYWFIAWYLFMIFLSPAIKYVFTKSGKLLSSLLIISGFLLLYFIIPIFSNSTHNPGSQLIYSFSFCFAMYYGMFKFKINIKYILLLFISAICLYICPFLFDTLGLSHFNVYYQPAGFNESTLLVWATSSMFAFSFFCLLENYIFQNNIINKFTSGIFSCYLIQSNIYVYSILNHFINTKNFPFGSAVHYFFPFLFSIIIIIVCPLFDIYIRQAIFRKIKFL
jgi:hypothetical protein